MNTLQQDLNNSFYTKFYQEFLDFTGNATSALVMGKLEFWFGIKKFRDGFFKFVEPCTSSLYREGDSWSEEVGASRKIFNKAFDIIGIRYNSKKKFLEAEDKFQGKLYASYHDRKTNLTYYVRNHEYVSQVLLEIFQKKQSPKKTIKKEIEIEREKATAKENLAILEAPETQNIPHQQVESDPSLGRSRNGDFGHSYAGASSSIHKETSSLENETQNSFPTATPVSHGNEETEEMIKIWNEEIGELGVSVTNGLLTRLKEMLENSFGGDLEAWRQYCQMISSSKFLMGEAQNLFFKKAWITWAMRPETIDKIKGGAYRHGDRKTNNDRAVDEINHEIQIVEIKKRRIEGSIADVRREIIEERKKQINEKIDNIPEEEDQLLKQEFIQHLETERGTMADEFKRAGWQGFFIECSYLGFLREKIAHQLFETSDEVQENRAIQASGLLERLGSVEKELEDLKQKKRGVGLKRSFELLSNQMFMATPEEPSFTPTPLMGHVMPADRNSLAQEFVVLPQTRTAYVPA